MFADSLGKPPENKLLEDGRGLGIALSVSITDFVLTRRWTFLIRATDPAKIGG
jgi:hypothetical protein